MKIKKELKNINFIYDESSQKFNLIDQNGNEIELNKIYAFAFTRFVVRMAQKNWLRDKKNVDKHESNILSLIEHEPIDPNQTTFQWTQEVPATSCTSNESV
jgi:hypothetical protein